MGYTSGMKTAISMPDELFEAMEEHVRTHDMTRSRFVQEAIREYLAARRPGDLTARVNEALASMTDDELEEDRAFARAASSSALRRTEW